KVFVYPSLAEGFGMPPLEAMASGVPVITSNSTALPEVVGDAGLTFDPGDAQALARHLQALLEDPSLRERCRERGLAQARGYTWEAAASVLRQAFERTAVR